MVEKMISHESRRSAYQSLEAARAMRDRKQDEIAQISADLDHVDRVIEMLEWELENCSYYDDEEEEHNEACFHTVRG